jgi:cytochrome c biogenesis protein CcmG, thiol:disulfide interchange protein DsbE
MAKFSPLMILPPAIFGAFVVMAGIGMFRDNPNALPSARLGQIAPPLNLTDLEGKPAFTDADLRDGTVKLVNFWASWCAPCRVEHPNLVKLGNEGLTIYGVNYKDKPENGLAFLAELGDPFTAVASDESGRTAIDWGVYGIPETFVIDGTGTIRLRYAGALTNRVIEETLRPALEAAAKSSTKQAASQ